uniref:Translation initiation factor IF-2-like isoform X2 n=1 Tax=Tursiops truncatus TaxID=9739 RepID=A0A6J3Q211_TURTR|nr:translation initiation factor IF-2-like isoform X2 [Tursiops truncatus]
MAAARRWRRRGRARGLVALRLGGLGGVRLAPRPRLLPGGAAGAAERRAAAAARAAPSSPRAGGGGSVVERCRQRRGGGRRRRVWERRLHRRGQAGGDGRAPLTPQQRGPREGAVSEETPKSPLALPAGGGGGTRWRRPGGREFSSWIPAGGGGETGPAEAAAATGGGGGADPASPLSRQYKRLGASPRTCPSQNGGRERAEVTQRAKGIHHSFLSRVADG